ncbi:MAG: hypothetical protein HQ596_08405 [Candidatus Saganbacteria bacterium]|nr:hypothetical protein [Candidatus Saganbacteria bacterium]
MVLIRGYSEVDEEAKIAIPSHIQAYANLEPNSLAEIEVIRIKNSNRRPYLVVHQPGSKRRISMLEVVFTNVNRCLDEKGKLPLDADLQSLSDLKPGHLVELKLCGSSKDPWVSIRYQGPKKLTTLQERMGIKKAPALKRSAKKWQKMTLNY